LSQQQFPTTFNLSQQQFPTTFNLSQQQFPTSFNLSQQQFATTFNLSLQQFPTTFNLSQVTTTEVTSNNILPKTERLLDGFLTVKRRDGKLFVMTTDVKGHVVRSDRYHEGQSR